MIIFSHGFQTTLKSYVLSLEGPAEVCKGKDMLFIPSNQRSGFFTITPLQPGKFHFYLHNMLGFYTVC